MSVAPSSTPKLKQWMIEQVDSEKYPGLVWEDRKLGMFRIPWKHANHQDYRHDKDAAIFEAWARFKGPCRDLRNLNPRTWKSRLRCALHKSSDFVEVPERSQLNNYQPYKVYKIVDSSFSQERMSPSIHLLAVKLEINDSDGMENSQQSSPGTQLGVSEQQAECEVPPLHYQQAESDSSCEPFSGFEASPPEEACVENTSLKWRLPAPDRESPSCAIDLSTVKMEGSGSVGTESSQPGSPYRGQGPSEQHVQSDGAAPTSQQMENDSGCDLCSDSERSTHKEFSAGSPLPDLGLESSMEVRMQSATEPSIPRQEGSKGGSGEQKNVCFLSSNRQLGMSEQAMGDGLVPKPTQTEVDRNGVPSSETATKGESPGGGPQMEWSLTPGAEAARNCTININTMPPSLPEKSNTSPRFINNYTINITSPVPAGQQEKVLSVPHNYTVNIHSAPLPGLPEKAVNSYTINIGSPVPASLPDRAVNSYTINIGSPMPAGFPDRVVNSYTINIGNTIPASLPDRETGNL